MKLEWAIIRWLPAVAADWLAEVPAEFPANSRLVSPRMHFQMVHKIIVEKFYARLTAVHYWLLVDSGL